MSEGMGGRPTTDYLGLLASKAASFPGVTAVDIGVGGKKGGASALIYTTNESVVVEHSGRRVTLRTKTPTELVEKVKLAWRAYRGPSIKYKGPLKE